MNDAVQAVISKVLVDLATPVYNQIRSGLRDEMTVGDRRTAMLDDGTEIGSVTHVHGREPELGILDEDAFLEWVKANHPDWLEQQVKPHFRQQAIEMAKRGLDEIPDGVGWKQPGRSYVKADSKPAQRALVLERLRSGELKPPLDAGYPFNGERAGLAPPKQLAGSDE